MKFRLLTFMFLLQCIVLIRTQFITIPTLRILTPTTSTAHSPTTTTSAAEPSTTTTSAAEPSTTTTSAAEPSTTTTSAAEPSTTTTSAAEPSTTTTSAAEPSTTTTSTAEPSTTTTSTDEPPTTTSAHTTSSPSVPTTTQKPILCPAKQSAFYKDDVSQLIAYLENDMKVMENFNHSVYGNVKRIADALMLELNTYLIVLEEQPLHISTTLDEINGTLENKIVPLIKAANTTLDELLSSESAKVAKIFAKMALLLTEKYKAEQYCKYTCDFSFRSLKFRNRVIIKDGDYLCSTISEVLDKIKIWFSSFMEEQKKYIALYINKHTHEIKESIGQVKEKLSETSKNILGVSMINVLHLHHDVNEAAKSIEEFNALAYKYRFGVINANLSMLQLEFEKNIITYREECVKCNSLAFRIDVSDERLPKTSNVLDELLAIKAVELEDAFHGIINSIFSDLYEKLNDDKLVEKTVRKLKPLVKDLALRTTQEREAFDDVMQSAPKKDRERMAVLYNETEIMFSSIMKENEKLKGMINDLS